VGFRLSCREASRLLSLRGERELGLRETVALRFHLWACDMCRNFDSQVRFLRKAAERFRSGAD